MICVIGAGGTVGGELIRQLESENARFRAAYFSRKKTEAARARGIDAVTVDYDRPETLRAALGAAEEAFSLVSVQGATLERFLMTSSRLFWFASPEPECRSSASGSCHALKP